MDPRYAWTASSCLVGNGECLWRESVLKEGTLMVADRLLWTLNNRGFFT